MTIPCRKGTRQVAETYAQNGDTDACRAGSPIHLNFVSQAIEINV
jgi:hypothetical protein